MRINRRLITFALLSGMVFSANAQDIYVSGILGYTMPSDATLLAPDSLPDLEGEIGFEDSIMFGGAAGLEMTESLRTELELTYSKNDIDSLGAFGVSSDPELVGFSGDVKSLNIFANGYYDLPMAGGLVPYIGGGLGMSQSKFSGTFEGEASSSKETVFAYHADVGLAYEISEAVTLDARYRYMGRSDIEDEGVTVEDGGSHNFLGSVRINF